MIVPKRQWRYPLAVEREYAKFLAAYVRKEFEIIQSFVPEMVELISKNSIQQDAFGGWLSNIMEKVKRKIEKSISAIPAINRIFNRADKHTKRENSETVKSVFNAEPKSKEKTSDLEMLKNIWAAQNMTLIKSVDEQAMQKIQNSLSQKIIGAVDKKKLAADLTREIEEIAKISEKRAALIAADQTGKLNGQLMRYRQMSAGIEEFQWITQQDKKVRPEHRARHGNIYRWDYGGELPGQAIRCRCVANPVFDEEKINFKPKNGSYLSVENK